MDRTNHYEAAVEAYLRYHRLCYVAVDESRRTILDNNQTIKSLDFVVCGSQGRLLLDVKGRRFPAGSASKPRMVWENWSTQADITGLRSWTERFGSPCLGLLLFVYELQTGVMLPDGTPDLWQWRGKRFLLRAVDVADYYAKMRLRSPKWGTVSLATADFRRLVRPFREYVMSANRDQL